VAARRWTAGQGLACIEGQARRRSELGGYIRHRAPYKNAPLAVFLASEDAKGVTGQGTTAFTSFGIENLKGLIEIHKANPSIIEAYRKLG
jgi:hypothetical protein